MSPVLFLVWEWQVFLSAQGKFWIPFEHHDLSVFTVAILAPPLRKVGILAILAFPALAWIQYRGFSAAEIQLIPERPLLPLFVYSLFALFLDFFRLQGLQITKVVAERTAEVRAMRRFTHSILAIKDLANSPLQAMLLDIALLKKKAPEHEILATRLGKSVSKLLELGALLNRQKVELNNDSEQISIDSLAELRKTFR